MYGHNFDTLFCYIPSEVAFVCSVMHLMSDAKVLALHQS